MTSHNMNPACSDRAWQHVMQITAIEFPQFPSPPTNWKLADLWRAELRELAKTSPRLQAAFDSYDKAFESDCEQQTRHANRYLSLRK
jgi:hypothetical protein